MYTFFTLQYLLPIVCMSQENIGMIAINDSFWLNSLAYVLLITKFRDHPCYTDLIDLFHLVCGT